MESDLFRFNFNNVIKKEEEEKRNGRLKRLEIEGIKKFAFRVQSGKKRINNTGWLRSRNANLMNGGVKRREPGERLRNPNWFRIKRLENCASFQWEFPQ